MWQQPQRSPSPPPVRLVDLPRDVHDLHGIDIETFVNPQATQGYLCLICQDVALEPVQQRCRLYFMCHQCFRVMERQSAFNRCLLQCNSEDVEYLFWNVNVFALTEGPYFDLELFCPHPGCGHRMVINDRSSHLRECPRDPTRFCHTCDITRVEGHNCRSYIQGLKRRIRDLEGHPGPPKGLLTYSNPKKSVMEWRDVTRITVVHDEIEYHYGDVFGEDQTVGDIRAAVTQDIGEDPGQLLILRHHLLEDSLRLRQCDIGHKPVRISALGASQTLRPGQLLRIQIGEPSFTI